MLTVGLTGGIACGKSTVARSLERKGALRICADQLAREAVEPGKPAYREIVSWLGREILTEEGTLDRKALADIVFHQEEARARLNAIVHGRVGELFQARSRDLEEQHPCGIQVWEVPLLFEAGMESAVDVIVVVASSEKNQLLRLQKRDGLSRSEALARIRAQLPLEQKINAGDFVLHNNDKEEDLERQTAKLWRKLVEIQRSRKKSPVDPA